MAVFPGGRALSCQAALELGFGARQPAAQKRLQKGVLLTCSAKTEVLCCREKRRWYRNCTERSLGRQFNLRIQHCREYKMPIKWSQSEARGHASTNPFRFMCQHRTKTARPRNLEAPDHPSCKLSRIRSALNALPGFGYLVGCGGVAELFSPLGCDLTDCICV